MNRRQFIKNTLQVGTLSLIGGKFIYNEISSLNNKNTIHKIYNELSQHVRLAKYTGENETTGKLLEARGYGIVLNNKYITMEHI